MAPVLIFQHLPCEGPGRLLGFAERHGVTLEVINFLEGGVVPRHREYSALVVLGGSMNVYEEELYPWLKEETAYIRDWVDAQFPYLGLCLGGQLLAKAVGGRVTVNARKEIGNFEVRLTEAGQADPLFAHFPPRFPVFQWHGDTFSDLGGGRLLANSEWCAHQAFAWGPRAWGLQYHPEITQEMAREWLHEMNADLVAEGLPAEPVYTGFAEREEAYQGLADRLFTNFFREAGILEGK